MSFTTQSRSMASAAVFCPQSKPAGESYLNRLPSFLRQSKHLNGFVQHIHGLRDIWSILASTRQDIADLAQGPRYIQDLSDWIASERSSKIVECKSSIVSLPLLLIIQICQYFQYLEISGKSHSQFLAELRTRGGLHGYCGGLLPAIAIACSKDEAAVVENAATAMRIALAIGAYGELGDDGTTPGATTIVCRLKQAGQGEELIARFPGVYISAVTDPKTVSLVGSVPILNKLQLYARDQDLLVQEMHIRGKMHNPENAELARELCHLCDKTDILRLPHVANLQVPTRSNRTGKLITNESLTHEIINVILASRCEWYALLTELAKDLDFSDSRNHTFAIFGIGDCVPLLPFHNLDLQITKIDVQSLAEKPFKGVPIDPSNDYQYSSDAVAVIGASCRLPGANNLDELWNLIVNGRSQHLKLSTDRFDLHGSFRASLDRKFTEKKRFFGNLIDDADSFDHAFFGVSPREALNMDPQQRVLLELAYQAMDSSGYMHSNRRDSGDSVGCFIGASFVEYLDNTNAYPPTSYTSTGTIRAFLSGKISYYFGWSGPSEVIDTACSSSLVAINRACKVIQSGECIMALAGGINIMTGMNNFLDLGKAGFLSPTGQCKPFDEAADGYCRSEGGGLVVLKLLNHALSDGDQILGIIPGTATNQGGLSASLTIPHSPTQVKLFHTVLKQSGMKPDQVTYVETHGTGTQAGDPVEIASVREVLGGQDRTHILNIGSIKGNIGHAETAAGVAGLLKVLVMIQKCVIPPQANFRFLNSKIPALEENKMAITKEAIHWEEKLRVAFVNSYGAAGSNAALICCNYSSPNIATFNQRTIEQPFPIIISATSPESLRMNIQNLGQHLMKALSKPNLGDVAFTLSKKREIHRHIFLTCALDTEKLAKTLSNEPHLTAETSEAPKPIVLVFGGQTKKTVGVDKTLYESYPCFRNYVDECDKIIMDLGHQSLQPSIFEKNPLASVVSLQCGTFAMQYACAKCWIDAGLLVEAVVGHSFGELTAMVVSGVLSLRDGLKLIACRASLMETKWGVEKGVMLVINSSRETVQEILAIINTNSNISNVEFACYNAPTSHVVVGSASAIGQTENLLRRDERFSKIRSERVDVTHGFHSKFTEGILDDLDQCSASVTYHEPKIYIEPCTALPYGKILANRFSQHAREPVYFSNAVQRIERRLGPCIWVESGMDSPITQMTKRTLAVPDIHTFHSMRTSTSQASPTMMCHMIMNLWREGILVSHWSFIPSQKNAFKQIWLPPYQFQPTKHWLKSIDRAIEARENAIMEKSAIEAKHAMSKPQRKLVSLKTGARKEDLCKEFRVYLGAERFTKVVSGHAVRERPLCPASMYMECTAMGVQLLRGHLKTGSIRFTNLSFHAALGVDPTREAFLILEDSSKAQGWKFVIKSCDLKSKFVTHAKGEVLQTEPSNFRIYERLIADRVDKLKSSRHTEKLMSSRAYGLFSRVVQYANIFRGISHIILDEAEAIADIDLSNTNEVNFQQSTVTQCCETIAIDTFIQVAGLLINSSHLITSEDVYVATGVEDASMSSICDFHNCKSWTVYAKYTSTSESQATGDIIIMTRSGVIAMMITGAQFTKLLISKLEQMLDSANASPLSKSSLESETISAKTTESFEISSTGSPPDTSEQSDMSTTSSSPPSSANSQASPTKTQVRHSLFKLLSESSGISMASIDDNFKLREIGIDSLSVIELWGDLVSAFDVEIDDNKFTLDSTIQEIFDFLNNQSTSQEEPSRKIADSPESTDQADNNSTTIPEESNQAKNKGIELTSLIKAMTECQATFEESARRRGFYDYWLNVAPKQDELLLAYICEAFQAQGTTLNQIAQGQRVPTINHLPKHAKVVNRLLEILEKHDVLTKKNSILIRSNGRVPFISSRQLHEQFIANFTAYKSEAQLMALTGPKLADCLTGKADPVGLMFHGFAAQKIMEDYYCASPMLSTLTEQMVNLIGAVVSSRNRGFNSPLRILEVGAGFGGTTTRLAEMLQASGLAIFYKFTDISSLLVKSAKVKFSKYTWMEFQTLNLENDIPPLLKGTYDIVIGTNCVHATTSKVRTISRLKSLLNNQGFIVLSEVTELIDWYDIVFGLLDGWWIADDNSKYPLQPPESWVQAFQQAGFMNSNITYSRGVSPESNSQRLFIASINCEVSADTLDNRKTITSMQTVVYKEVEDIKVEADIYLPLQSSVTAMPVAIMIHGGGYMTLSRKAIRPFQTAFLLANNVLPISIDYRLCPEVNLIDGPIKDVCDAYAWVQNGNLQAAVGNYGITIDRQNIALIGWSTGGHLAMTTAWTSKAAGLMPPRAILSFYGPTDFESGDLNIRRGEEFPERRLSMDEIMFSLPEKPVTGYPTSLSCTDASQLGWLRPGDPRSELVLSLFKEGNGLPLLLTGINSSASSSHSKRAANHKLPSFDPHSLERIASISPLSHVRNGTYRTPTCLIHGTEDEIVPFHSAQTFYEAMKDAGLPSRLVVVKGAKHIHDLSLKEGDEGWWEGVGIGYEFLFQQFRL